jgi:hypothetical protein
LNGHLADCHRESWQENLSRHLGRLLVLWIVRLEDMKRSRQDLLEMSRDPEIV